MTTRGVYAIICVDGRAYVGGTSNLSNRWAVHRYQLRHKKHVRKNLQAAWDLLGEESFSFVLLEIVPSDGVLHEAEQRWMDKLEAVSKGFNRAPNAPDNTGIVFPPEVRANMSKAQRGKKLSPAHCAMISARSRLLVHTPEAKRKMSLARKGKFVGEKHPQAKMNDTQAREVIALSEKGLFKREIAALFGVSRSCISHIVNGHTFGHIRKHQGEI